MRNVLKAAAALPGLAYGWIVAASAIYCAGTGKMALFQFPFTQWIQAAPYWRLNWWMTLWVSISGGLPTLLLIVCAFGMVRHHWRNRPSEIYGKTEWADQRDMKAGNISANRRPF